MTKLVEISGLNIRFTGERTVYAVNDLSLSLDDGEVLGLLGESGSGKSVTLRALMRLLPKKRTQISGKVNVMGRDVLAMNDEQLSSFRGRTVSMIFVTHDIGVAIEICDRVAVMYAGQIVEQGTLRDIVRSPVHPYAKGLLASTIHGAKRGQRLETIPGTPPSLAERPRNCSFAPRCTVAQPRCLEQLPATVEVGPGRAARCVLAAPVAAS